MIKIKDLKKGESFKFNNYVHIVDRPYKNDNKPLLSTIKGTWESNMFHNDELQVEKVDTDV